MKAQTEKMASKVITFVAAIMIVTIVMVAIWVYKFGIITLL